MIAHYPVELWLCPSPEGKERQLAPTPRRCSACCLKYQQCVPEERESPILPHTIIPGAGPVWWCIARVMCVCA
ncbi:hypothetical protein TNCV_1816591 [Trichonephila clavipes]|nr:hypothetical protein TNCV_1816591 [Trichonephila clavipes]